MINKLQQNAQQMSGAVPANVKTVKFPVSFAALQVSVEQSLQQTNQQGNQNGK